MLSFIRKMISSEKKSQTSRTISNKMWNDKYAAIVKEAEEISKKIQALNTEKAK